MDLTEKLKADGFDPIQVLDNKYHRFNHQGGDLNGWFVGTNLAANYGDWKTGKKYSWTMDDSHMSPEAQAEIKAHTKAAGIEFTRARDEEYEKRAIFAKGIIDQHFIAFKDAPLHPYLKSKGLDQSYKAIHNTDNKELYIPVYDVTNKLWGFQRINPQGKKRFLKGAKKKGCFHVIPSHSALKTAAKVFIAEGFSTAASIYAATKIPVIVCFDTSNLSIGKVIKEHHPHLQITYAADNDAFTKATKHQPKNPGVTLAQAAAKQIQAKVIYPTFQTPNKAHTDFNDLHQAESLEVVKAQLIKTANTGLNYRSFTDFCQDTADSIDWLVDDLIPLGGVSALIGREKVGKTTFVRQLCHSVLTGTDFLTRKIHKTGPVFYTSLDESPVLIKVQFKKLGITKEPLFIHTGMFEDNAANHLDRILESLPPKQRPVLLILDTLAKCTKMDEVNSYSSAVKAIAPFQDLAYRWNLHILFTHHAGKAQDREGMDVSSGSTAITGCTDVNILVGRDPEADGGKRFIRTQMRIGKGWDEDQYFDYDEETCRITLTGPRPKTNDVNHDDEIIDALVELPIENHSHKALKDFVGVGTQALKLGLERLCRAGRIRQRVIKKEAGTKGGKPQIYYEVIGARGEGPPIVDEDNHF